jgi:hypothetical protein
VKIDKIEYADAVEREETTKRYQRKSLSVSLSGGVKLNRNDQRQWG